MVVLHTEIPANDARLSRQPGPGEAVVITRYGTPELVVLRWDDFMPLENLIDQYLAEPPHELGASALAVRAQTIDDQLEGVDFDYSGLANALGE